MAITTFVRADRFCDGVHFDEFEKGRILKTFEVNSKQATLF
jgi:hypothetical protein